LRFSFLILCFRAVHNLVLVSKKVLGFAGAGAAVAKTNKETNRLTD
jgi:hypothetical protein